MYEDLRNTFNKFGCFKCNLCIFNVMEIDVTYSDSELEDGSVLLFPLKTRDGDLTDVEESLEDSYFCRNFFLYILKMFE